MAFAMPKRVVSRVSKTKIVPVVSAIQPKTSVLVVFVTATATVVCFVTPPAILARNVYKIQIARPAFVTPRPKSARVV